MTRAQPEQEVQKAVMQYLDAACPDVLALAIPNGGYRRKAEAAILKGMGVKAGCPDILILWNPGRCAFIELKAPNRKNDLSAAQDRFMERLTRLTVPNAVCASIDEVRAKLKQWGVPTRDRSLL